MPFAQYTDGVTSISAIRWDGTEEVSADVIYQIPGVSVHLNTIGDIQVKELRFNDFLIVPEGDWVVIVVTSDSVTASKMTDTQFNSTYTLV